MIRGLTPANIKSGVNILGVTGTLNACTAPADCTTPGAKCADGSIFAGFMVNNTSCTPLYTTDNNQARLSRWNDGGGHE